MATQTITLDIPETGLNLTAQVDTVAGSSFASSVDVAESGSLAGRYSFPLTDSAGQYRIELTDDDDSGSLLAVLFVETTNTTASFRAVDELLLLDIEGDTGGGGGGPVQISGLTPEAIAQLAGTVIRLAPTEVPELASLDIVRGADYSAADETDHRWYVDTPVDLTGATAVLTLKRGSTSQAFPGTVTNSSGTNWTISVEMTAVETEVLAASCEWTYTLDLILASSRKQNVRKPGQRARVLSST